MRRIVLDQVFFALGFYIKRSLKTVNHRKDKDRPAKREKVPSKA